MAKAEKASRKKVTGELETCDQAFNISWYFAMAFLVIGVVAEVTKWNLGLAPISWFLLLVAALLAAIIFRLGWAVAWYLTVTK